MEAKRKENENKQNEIQSVGRKVVDFMLGFFVGLVLIIFGAMKLSYNQMAVFLYIIVYLMAIIFFFRIRKKYVALGILLSVIISFIVILIIIGSCTIRIH